MSVDIQGLFSGVAVIIDDQADTGSEPGITAILDTIRAAGGLAIVHKSLPKTSVLRNYSNVAFVMMDWDLSPPGAKLSDDQKTGLYQDNVEFIRALGAHRHTPVVIFTNEIIDDVREFLEIYDDMRDHLESGRILLKDKGEVGDQIYAVLNKWAAEVPSVYTLKTWEQESVRALNELFMDLHDRSPHWPVMLWESYSKDGPTPADDLGKLITRLVASRMDQLPLDLAHFVHDIDDKHEQNPVNYEKTLQLVLSGERFLDAKRLHASSSAPGDVFQQPKATKTIWVNIRPECDAVRREGVEKYPDLYLLKGELVDQSKIDIGEKYGEIRDRDDQFTIYAMLDGKSYRFGFKDLEIKPRADWEAYRKGRLLPPFSTRLQQKYAAYLQRSGVSAVPRVLRKRIAAADQVAPNTGQAPQVPPATA
ncbi:hypothetical protein [Xanthomonas campestris]|uniref:hypothetical protein n=1 Tax=Xanthomonas campestris TaxID=339 RepID=UPI000E0F8492|nr:hypothetical protein [Xanthomonas campestris]MDM7753917.1 hypothetical protein [Xanthomonas campestris pv. campestris]MDM7762304.1 hypothetical protein [Xanthomonas campestris pv. campestris]MEB1955754.1 hypothetical protein [Xanthomonas campestris pv. campestris]